MLNRRIIRVKALQSLYSRHQLFAAEKLAALDQFLERIQLLPEFYNDSAANRKNLLNHLRNKAAHHFQHVVEAEVGAFPEWVLEPLNDSIKELKASLQKIHKKALNDMVNSLAAAWSLFGALLAFMNELAEFVLTDEHEKRNRLLHKEYSAPHQLKLAQNRVVNNLKADSTFTENLAHSRYRFYKDQELIRKAYKEVLCALPQYQEYREKLQIEEADEVEILRILFKKLLKYELLNDTLSEEDLNWTENKILIEVLAKNFFRVATEKDAFKIQFEKFKEEIDDDRDFLINLYLQATENSQKFDELIKQTVQNWDLNRIAVTDYLILQLAMAEMMYFPHIPVKVTINEYLEVSKIYSTPASSTFLNGILDKVADMMQRMNLIKKSARGLMDNK